MSDCILLLERVDWLGALVGAVEKSVARSPDPVDFVDRVRQLGEYGDATNYEAVVSRLRFGSPFLIHLFLGVGSVPGFAMLIYGAKRLFGLDLEFKAHRHRLGAEYEQQRAAHIEAKRLADRLERQVEPVPLPAPPRGALPRPVGDVGWKAQRGVVSSADESPELPDESP